MPIAMIARQGPIIELLTMWKAGTSCDDEAGELYRAASRLRRRCLENQAPQ
jgi:hypothetical protein